MRRGDFLYYRDGELIFAESSPGKEIYVIESGKVEISKRVEGKKMTIVVLEKGDFFGEMAPLTGSLRSASATAIGDTYLMSMSMDEMIQQMQGDPKFMLDVFQTLISRLRNTTSELRTMTFRSQISGKVEGGRYETLDREANEEMFNYLRKKLQRTEKQLEEQQEKLHRTQQLLDHYQSRWWCRMFGKQKG